MKRLLIIKLSSIGDVVEIPVLDGETIVEIVITDIRYRHGSGSVKYDADHVSEKLQKRFGGFEFIPESHIID